MILQEMQHYGIYCAGEANSYFFACQLLDSRIIDVHSILDVRDPTELSGNKNCFNNHKYCYCTLTKACYLAQGLNVFKLRWHGLLVDLV